MRTRTVASRLSRISTRITSKKPHPMMKMSGTWSACISQNIALQIAVKATVASVAPGPQRREINLGRTARRLAHRYPRGFRMHVALDLPMLGRAHGFGQALLLGGLRDLEDWHLELRVEFAGRGGRAGAETPDDFVVAIWWSRRGVCRRDIKRDRHLCAVRRCRLFVVPQHVLPGRGRGAAAIVGSHPIDASQPEREGAGGP